MNDRIIIHGIQIQKTSPRRETKERSQSFEKGEFYLSFSQQMIINDETLKSQTGGSSILINLTTSMHLTGSVKASKLESSLYSPIL